MHKHKPRIDNVRGISNWLVCSPCSRMIPNKLTTSTLHNPSHDDISAPSAPSTGAGRSRSLWGVVCGCGYVRGGWHHERAHIVDSLGQPLGMGATPEDYYLVPLSLRLSMPLLSPLGITVFRYKSTSRPRL